MQEYRYRINEIRLNIKEDEDLILDKLAKKVGLEKSAIKDLEIVRKSIDARHKNDIKLVYSIDFSTGKKLNLPKSPDRTYLFPKAELDKNAKIAIVGFGPAGIFAGLALAQMGYRPLIFERGRDVDQRTLDVEDFWKRGNLNEESNVQFGEGGAGAFSDGKLTTNIRDKRIGKVLSELVKAGGPKEILYKHKAHIGTDLLKGVVKNIRQEIIKLGGRVYFSHKLKDIYLEEANKSLKRIIVEKDKRDYEIPCDKLILALGHSARDTFKLLKEKGFDMEQKNFSMGLRIQHPQDLINKAQYGDPGLSEILGPAEYKLNCKTDENRGVYTFCMCPGGEIILSSSKSGTLVSNGMSYHKRDGQYANSGLLVDVRKSDFPSDDVLAGIYLQESVEKRAYELARRYDLLESSIREFHMSDLSRALPDFVVRNISYALPILSKMLEGFSGKEALLKGPETRSSSPVRIIRDKNYEANIKNIYPIGEGAGYAGGIMSAAVDGIRVAESIASRGE